MSLQERVIELSQHGYVCSQIVVMLGCEEAEEPAPSPDLVRALNGLAGGLFCQEGVCGALNGGACLLSLFAGKAELDESARDDLPEMVIELKRCFDARAADRGATCICGTLIDHDRANIPDRCPAIVHDTLCEALRILEDRGYL